jgi:hypothetical protein
MYVERCAARLTAAASTAAFTAGRVSGYDVMTYDWMMFLALAGRLGCTALTGAGLQ